MSDPQTLTNLQAEVDKMLRLIREWVEWTDGDEESPDDLRNRCLAVLDRPSSGMKQL